MRSRKAVILGGGPAGLYAAWTLLQLGFETHLIEREPVIGGLCASLPAGLNCYSHGTHAFHDADAKFLEEFRSLTGNNAIGKKRQVRIQLGGQLYPYPLRGIDLWRSLPVGLAMRCLCGFGGALLAAPFHHDRPGNAEEAIVRLYGRTLYEAMFADYTQRFWGMPVREISAEFVAQRMPRFNPAERVRSLLARLGLGDRQLNSRRTELGAPVMYSTPRGMGAMFEVLAARIEAAGGRIQLNAEAVRVLCANGSAQAVVWRRDGIEKEQECDLVVSTIPVRQLVQRMEPARPSAVLEAASGLHWLGMITVGLLVRKTQVLDGAVTYFHGRSFHRVSEPRQSGVEVYPSDCTTLLAEVTCKTSDKAWSQPSELCAQVVRDLRAKGVVQPEDIVEQHLFRAEDAYPAYLMGFEPKLAAVRADLGTIRNLVSTGRQGRFDFMTAATAMKMARADVLAGLARLDA